MFNDGLQVPLMPLVEVVGKAESASPEQIAATGLNVGVVRGVTVMLTVTGSAQSPAVGVKV